MTTSRDNVPQCSSNKWKYFSSSVPCTFSVIDAFPSASLIGIPCPHLYLIQSLCSPVRGPCPISLTQHIHSFIHSFIHSYTTFRFFFMPCICSCSWLGPRDRFLSWCAFRYVAGRHGGWGWSAQHMGEGHNHARRKKRNICEGVGADQSWEIETRE